MDLAEDVKTILIADDNETARRAMRKGNAIGKILIAMTGPALLKVNRQACKEKWRVRATQVFVALRCYRLKTGDLPDELTALTPDYIESVPVDPFDGKPLRYDRKERRIHASSEKYREEGGSLKIPFGAPVETREAPKESVQPKD